MAASRKRKKRDDQDSALSQVETPRKKLRITGNDNGPKSMFRNYSDHKEFLPYFHALEQALTTSVCISVPKTVTRECAEFATGRSEECSTADCEQSICILHVDEQMSLKQLIDADASKKLDKWSYCAVSENYFCPDCLNFCSKYFCWEGVKDEEPTDIVNALMLQYPQIETWLKSMKYHNTVTTLRIHAIQFLASLMDKQPQFIQLIKHIQDQLKRRGLSCDDDLEAIS